MRLLPAVLFSFSLINISSAENMDVNDAVIYRSALKTIVEHEKPAHFAVWNQTVDGSTLMAARVPRHAPENQFVESLAKLPADLQTQLQRSQSAGLVPFEKTISFIDNKTLVQSNPQLLAIGFSKIAYDTQHNALLYSEACLVTTAAECGGEAFWFVQSAGTWKVKKHAYLWAGVSSPFWSISTH